MKTIGMITLGLFVGCIVTIGVKNIPDWTNVAKLLAAIISSVFAGSIFTIFEKYGGGTIGKALYFYPVGLALGLMFAYAPAAVDNIRSLNTNVQILGWVHILAMGAAWLILLLLLFFPSIRERLPSED